jgi:hypothetical protein
MTIIAKVIVHGRACQMMFNYLTGQTRKEDSAND